MKSSENQDVSVDFSDQPGGELVAFIRGRMDHQTAAYLLNAIGSRLKRQMPKALTVSLEHVSYFDDYGALVLFKLKEIMADSRGEFRLLDPDHKSDSILSLFDIKALQKPPARLSHDSDNIIIRLGQSTIDHLSNIKTMVAFVGSVCLSFIHAIIHSKSLRFNDTIVEMEKTGVNAVPIVSLISYLLGLVIAFMSSLQLEQFGANIYVASLVAIAMVSELSPIMTAIVVAGRSGSAFAAEIGTMKIYEEVDALTTMGFDPVLFLAIPRMIASMIVVPILTLCSGLCGILGGLTVGIGLLNLTPSSYMSQTLETLDLFEITWGLSKSIVFAAIISWVGCLRGFQAKGGADAVGNAATSAVVGGIFLIILFDSFFAILRSYWW